MKKSDLHLLGMYVECPRGNKRGAEVGVNPCACSERERGEEGGDTGRRTRLIQNVSSRMMKGHA